MGGSRALVALLQISPATRALLLVEKEKGTMKGSAWPNLASAPFTKAFSTRSWAAALRRIHRMSSLHSPRCTANAAIKRGRT